jgi:hypothetical protein
MKSLDQIENEKQFALSELRAKRLNAAQKIWEILQRTCGAGTYWGSNFVRIAQEYLETGKMLEYRFQGNLGFGGKVWINNGDHPYVTCYPEDMSPDKQKMIDAANAELKTVGL